MPLQVVRGAWFPALRSGCRRRSISPGRRRRWTCARCRRAAPAMQQGSCRAEGSTMAHQSQRTSRGRDLLSRAAYDVSGASARHKISPCAWLACMFARCCNSRSVIRQAGVIRWMRGSGLSPTSIAHLQVPPNAHLQPDQRRELLSQSAAQVVNVELDRLSLLAGSHRRNTVLAGEQQNLMGSRL